MHRCCFGGKVHPSTRYKKPKSKRATRWRDPRTRDERGAIHEYDARVGGWWGEAQRVEINIASEPFAVGSFHAVHCATLAGERYVVKFGLEHSDCSLEVYLAQLQAQQRAGVWATAFNRRASQAGIKERVHYTELRVISLPDRGDVSGLLEPFLEGEFEKFNDNTGHVFGCKTAQAFSHLTWEDSKHTEMMCDVQGIVGGYYSDALLHTVDGQAYGGGRHGNRGKRGITDFLDSHKCNSICAALNLPHIEGCDVAKSRRGSKTKSNRCPICGSAKKWDVENEACWRCDGDYLTQVGLDATFME